MKKIFFLSILICIISCNSDNKNFAKETENSTLELDSLVRYGKLDNGFTYYLRDNDSETTELRMVVKAGIYHEDEDQLEYAHLLEHVGTKDPKHFPNEDKYFNTAGRSKHARTSYDNTFYYVWMPSQDKEGIQNGLQLVRDWAQDISLEKESIDVERGAVLGEGREYDSHMRWWFDTIDNELLKNTGFKLPARNKYKANIQNFNRESFIRFYKEWYRPDLEAAIVVGDIDVDSVETEIKRLFSDLKMPKHARNAQEKVVKQTIILPGENQYATILDTLEPDLRVYILSKRMNREFGPKNRADFKDMLLQQLYEKIISSRSNWLNQQYNPPFSSFLSDYHASTVGAGQLYVSMMTVEFKNDDPQLFKERFQNGLIAWKRLHSGFTTSELEKMKNQIKENYSTNEIESSRSLAEKYTKDFVLGTETLNPKEENKLILDLLEQISLKEIQDFALDYGDFKNNMDFLIFTGGEHSIPDKKEIKKWVSKVEGMKVKPLSEPKAKISSLSNVTQIPLKEDMVIESRSDNLIGVSTITLKNGIKLILKPTKPISESFSNTVSIQAFRSNNLPPKNREEYLTAKVAPEVIQYSGAGSYTKFDLERFKYDKGLKLRFEINKDAQIIQGKSNMENIGELLNLIYLYIDQPRRDKEAFAMWKDDQREVLNGKAARGSSEFYMDEIHALWYPQVPRLKIDDLEQLTMEKVFDAYKQWFTDLNGYTFIVTGDFNKERLEPILIKNLTAFPTKRKSSSVTESKFDFPLKKMDKTIRLKNSDQAFVRLFFPVTAPKDLKTQVELRLLSKALYDRIWDRLRAGSYAPGAGGDWVDKQDGIFGLRINFDSNLGNEEKMISMALEEFRRLRKNGVNQTWFDRTIADEISAYEGRFKQFGYFNFWSDYLQKKQVNGEDPMKEVLQYGTFLEHFVTLEDVNTAAKKYMSEENLQQFLVIPEGYHPNKSVSED